MKRVVVIFIIFSFVLNVVGAKENFDDSQYDIEMAEVGEPGTLVIRVWCYSKKPRIDEEVAKMNAIKGVLFKGVSDSGRIKGRKPLVEDGYECHKEYFDVFFKEGKYGKYSRVSLNNYVEQNGMIKVGKKFKIGKIVVISYNALRKQLENDKIIKGLNYGF